MVRTWNRSRRSIKNDGSTESSGRRRQPSKSYGEHRDEVTIDVR